MRLSALVETSEGGLVPVGAMAVDPPVAAVITSDLLDPRRYLTGGELVLTGLAWWQPDRPGRSRGFVAALIGGGAVGLAAGEAQLGYVPDDLVVACAEAGFPLLRVPVAHSFAAVIDRATRQLSGRDDLGAVLARHRALIAVAARQGGGSGLDGVLDLVRADLDLACWVLSPTGRPIAGWSTGSGAGVVALDELERRALVRQFLRAAHLPVRVARPSGQVMSLLLAGPSTPRAASWVLAVAGDHTEWTAERHTIATELAALVALEVELSRRRPDADHNLVAALNGSSATEVERTAAICGLDVTRPAVVVVALIAPGEPAALSASGERVGAGLTAHVVLTEALADARPAGGWALGELAGEVIAVAPSTSEPASPSTNDGSGGGGTVLDAIRGALAVLAPGLGAQPVRIGVSDPVSGGAGLLGALAEARAAAKTADGTSPHVVVGPERLSSHALLLAAVPAELRQAYRNRVLGPLLEHDRLHHTDLLRTLRMYLECSGSWSRCAAAMHIHVNTLRYRMDRISALTGRDLRRLEDQTDLLLALNLP